MASPKSGWVDSGRDRSPSRRRTQFDHKEFGSNQTRFPFSSQTGPNNMLGHFGSIGIPDSSALCS